MNGIPDDPGSAPRHLVPQRVRDTEAVTRGSSPRVTTKSVDVTPGNDDDE